MVVQLPFLRPVYHTDRHHPNRAFYWMIPVHGRWVRAVQVHCRAGGSFLYMAVTKFMRDYRQLLGLGHRLMWTSKFDLDKWLEALVHNSFVRCSVPGVLHCWYEKKISHADLDGPMLLPSGCARDFNTVGGVDWVLLKHGPWSWPVRVVNNTLRNGWVEFRNAHDFQINYRLILVCERRWVFTAIVLDENGKQMWTDWAEMVNPYWRALYPPQVRTAFTLSEFEDEYPLSNSGYSCMAGVNYQEEFERRIQLLLLHDADIDNVLIRMKHRMWSIPSENGHLNAEVFGEFMGDLDVGEYDYLFVSVLPVGEVRVVVFEGIHGTERLYAWV